MIDYPGIALTESPSIPTGRQDKEGNIYPYTEIHTVKLVRNKAICLMVPEGEYDRGDDVSRPGYPYLYVDVYDDNHVWALDFTGIIKWDGCSNWNVEDCWHLCGAEDAGVFQHIYRLAQPLMNNALVAEGKAPQ